MREVRIAIEKENFKKKLGIKDGVDGKTPTKEELIDIIKPLIPEPKKEVIIEKTEVIKEQPIITQIENNDTGEQIVEKIKDEKKWIKVDALNDNTIAELRRGIRVSRGGGGSNSLKLLTDVVLDNVPQDSKGNYIVGGLSKVTTDTTLTGDGTIDNPLKAVSDTTKLSETYESISKNIKAYPYAFNKTGDVLDNIVYTTPDGTITKTFNRTGTVLNTIVLSGDTPSGISLTKTFNRTGSEVTSISYS